MKNKRLWSMLLVFILILSAFLSTNSMSFAADMEGAGTEEYPYLIRTVEDLYSIPDNPEAHYKLMNNLDLGGVERAPLAEFKGVLDGNEKKIRNLFVTGNNHVGLFSISRGATFTDIIIDASNSYGTGNIVGILSGRIINSSITRCVVMNSTVTAGAHAGGMVGATDANEPPSCLITDSYVENTNVSGTCVGGIVGNLDNKGFVITNCYFTGELNAGTMYGVATTRVGTIIKSYFNKDISGISSPDTQARSTAQMYQKSNYEGWDFENVWYIDEAKKDYPRLRFESTQPAPIKTLKVVLEPNEELQLSVDDDIAENLNMVWSSLDEGVATVDNMGVVKALKKGNTIVTVKSSDSKYIMEIKVLVYDSAKEHRLAIDLSVDKSCRLTIDEAEDTTPASWSSSNLAVATVTDKGRVTAVAKGLSMIQAKDTDGEEIGQVYVRVR